MTNFSRRSRSNRQHKKRTKLTLVLGEIAPQLDISDLNPDVISRLSKYAHDITRIGKKQISSKDELFKILEDNNSITTEDEANEWLNRHVLMPALIAEDSVDRTKQISFSGLPVQFLFAANYLKQAYESNKDPEFFYQVIDEGRYYPGDELLNYLMRLLEEKDLKELTICFLNLLDDNAKNYYVALAATIVLNCEGPIKELCKQLAQRLGEIKAYSNPERTKEMIDPISLPILMRAINFVFDEGSKILQERRERRIAQNASKTQEPPSPPIKTDASEDSNSEFALAINSKDSALSEKIEKAAWLLAAGKVEEKLSLLDINQKNLSLAKEQYAKWGGALVPQVVVHNLEEAENNVITLIVELQEILGKVYGKKFVLPYLE